MQIWTIVIVVISMVLLIVYIIVRLRGISWRLKAAATRLDKYIARNGRTKRKDAGILSQLYGLVKVALAASDAAAAYRAVDLLKLAFGSGVVRGDEAALLASLAIAAIHYKRPDVAEFILDAFKPLLRNLTGKTLCDAAEQLAIIGAVGLRARHNFIIAKAAEMIFFICDRLSNNKEAPSTSGVLRAVRIIGMMALRRRDTDLYREVMIRFADWVKCNHQQCVDAELAHLMIEWLHSIIKIGDVQLFRSWTTVILDFTESAVFSGETIKMIIKECEETAGITCLNPHSEITTVCISFLLEYADRSRNVDYWNMAVKATGQVGSLAFSRWDARKAYHIVFPLLNEGRKLLIEELSFAEYCDVYRQKKLFSVLKECLFLTELKARQQMTSSAGEIVADIYCWWTERPDTVGMQKSVKKFCQLLLLYWQKNRQRQAKRSMPICKELSSPILFSEIDRKRLGI